MLIPNIVKNFTTTSASSSRAADVGWWWMFIAAILVVGVSAATAWASDAIKVLAVVFGAAAIIATLASLERGLLCIVAIVYLNLSAVLVDFHNAPPLLLFYEIILLCLISGRWLIRGEAPGEGTREAALVLGAYGLVSFLSVLIAERADRVMSDVVLYGKDAIIGLTVVMLLVRLNTLRSVVWVLIGAGVILCGATIYQLLTQTYPVALGGLAQAELSLGGELYHPQGDNSVYDVVQLPRYSGPLTDPNCFGQILVFLLPLAFERMVNGHHRLLRLLAAGSLVLIFITIMLTYSRGAMLALGCMGVLGLASLPWSRALRGQTLKVLAIVVLCCAAAAYFAPDRYLDRVGTMTSLVSSSEDGSIVTVKENDEAASSRLDMMKCAFLMFLDNPVFGVGFGNYEVHYRQYELRYGFRPKHKAYSAHSLYLEIAAEQGLIGLAVFGFLLWMAARSILQARRTFQEAGLPEGKNIATALGIGFFGYLVAATFLHNGYARYFYLIIGIVLALRHVAERERGTALPRASSSFNDAHRILDRA